jgi:hypothetical protein
MHSIRQRCVNTLVSSSRYVGHVNSLTLSATASSAAAASSSSTSSLSSISSLYLNQPSLVSPLHTHTFLCHAAAAAGAPTSASTSKQQPVIDYSEKTDAYEIIHTVPG